MTDRSVWDEEIPVPERMIRYIDQGVIDRTTVHGISKSGASYWARTAKIDAKGPSGENTPFFLKAHQYDRGKEMASSEFASMKTLHGILPENVAEPIAWGTYTDSPDTYFLVSRFLPLQGLPVPKTLVPLVAKLHRVTSPMGNFGSQRVTYGGRNPQFFPPSTSWEESFSRGLSAIFDLEDEMQGPDEKMRKLRKGVMERVIPRLLRPLEMEGRVLVPRLVHGDLWAGNAAVDAGSGRAIIFDAVPLFAHNEYELGPWWAPVGMSMTDYIDEYLIHFPKSEPVEDFGDRCELYSLRFHLNSSALYPGNLMFRHIVIESMRCLTEKYPHGYQGYQRENDLLGGVSKESVGPEASIAISVEEPL